MGRHHYIALYRGNSLEIGNSGTKKDNANISGNVNIDNADASAGMGSAATAGNILNELIQTGVNIGYVPLIALLLSIGVFYEIHRKKHRD